MTAATIKKLKYAIDDLKFADQNTFDQYIKKLSSILKSTDLNKLSERLLSLIDLEEFLEKGDASKGSMAGSCRLDWPIETKLELGIKIALTHFFAENSKNAINFAYSYYYSANNITRNLQNMTGHIYPSFYRDFTEFIKQELGEFMPASEESSVEVVTSVQHNYARKVFIVHGHDNEPKLEMARLLEKLDFEAIILHEQINKNRTIIEKIEANSDVGFAVVLLTPDDHGGMSGKDSSPRARQNVILELGYFIGRLGRERVAVFKKKQY